MTFLLDVNVLIALIDPAHICHDAAHRWFGGQGRRTWASCPITENGVIRIVSHPKYANTPGSPAIVADVVRAMCSMPEHVFWPDHFSLLDADHVDMNEFLSSRQLTDAYLLGLAVANKGMLATFDRNLSARAIPGGEQALLPLPTA